MYSRLITIVILLSFTFLTKASSAESLSPAEKRIRWAHTAIEKNPEAFAGYNKLALALARRARETGNPAYYDKAGAAIETSFRLSPDNFQAQRVKVWTLLGKHEFAQALEAAKKLNKRVPDDILTYGFLADAHTELGNYDKAEQAAQWMLNMRPGNVPGLTRGAYLRELFGDTEGAVEFMSSAFHRTSPIETEDRAWILTQIADLYLSTGKLELAESVVQQALELFPGYHYALASLGKLRLAQGRFDEAAEVFEKRFEAAPHPENLLDIAVALEHAGKTGDASAAFAKFEILGRQEMNGPDNCNRELVFYYTDYAARAPAPVAGGVTGLGPEEALRIARMEIERRQDVFTRDAYAWALHTNGYNEEAQEQIERALSVGIRNAKMLYHAGAIAAKLGDRSNAEDFWRQSVQANPTSEVAGRAKLALRSLDASPNLARLSEQ